MIRARCPNRQARRLPYPNCGRRTSGERWCATALVLRDVARKRRSTGALQNALASRVNRSFIMPLLRTFNLPMRLQLPPFSLLLVFLGLLLTSCAVLGV